MSHRQRSIRTIFLDRDGVINDVVMRNGAAASPRSIDEFHLRSDFVTFYETIKNFGLNLFVVSNQPDLARNLMNENELRQMTERIAQTASLKEVRYCPHDDCDDCACRKPKPGMICQLLEKYNLAADEAIIIGDSYKDILAGDAAGVGTVYLLGSYNATVDCKPGLTIRNLLEITQHYTFAPTSIFTSISSAASI